LMRARKEDVELSDLLVTPTDYRLVSATTREPLRDYPYMIFTITKTKERSDWFKLPDLTRPYQELQAAVRKPDYNASKELIISFKRAALTSDDLLTEDAKRIVKLVKDKAEAVMEGTLTARDEESPSRELPPLESYPLYT